MRLVCPPLQRPARLLKAACRGPRREPSQWLVPTRGYYRGAASALVGADAHRHNPQAPTWPFRPPRFVAWELALVQLTEPTAEGATLWKKLASVSLAPVIRELN